MNRDKFQPSMNISDREFQFQNKKYKICELKYSLFSYLRIIDRDVQLI